MRRQKRTFSSRAVAENASAPRFHLEEKARVKLKLLLVPRFFWNRKEHVFESGISPYAGAVTGLIY
jgi:hypothetical protein